MFYPKLRHTPSNSIIDISSHPHRKNASSNHNQNRAHSQARTSSIFSHHQLCHSYSDDSLDKEFLQHTKQTFDQLFRQTNFNQILDQIQYTLQPIVKQLREQTERKTYLSKQERLVCMKSCAKFITDTLLHEQCDIDESFIELYHLQQVLHQFLSKQQTNITVQTSEQLESGMMQLHIGNNLKESPKEQTELKLKKPTKVSFLPADEQKISPTQSTDELTRQKNYHRSVSRAFKKLNADLQKMNHETPFKAHLSKYHKHNH